MLTEPDCRFSWEGKSLVPDGTRTPGRQKCLMCEGYGLEGATTCLLTLSALCPICSRNAFPDLFVHFKARSWFLRLQIHKDLSSEKNVKAINFPYYYQRRFPTKNHKTYFPIAQISSPKYLLELILLFIWYFFRKTYHFVQISYKLSFRI